LSYEDEMGQNLVVFPDDLPILSCDSLESSNML
jgi:hypothetical protein